MSDVRIVAGRSGLIPCDNLDTVVRQMNLAIVDTSSNMTSTKDALDLVTKIDPSVFAGNKFTVREKPHRTRNVP